jgi:hypothetical protein
MIAATDSYRHLRAQAVDLLGEHGGSMEATALAGALFGASSPFVSGRLLDAVLGDDPRFRRETSSWSLALVAAPRPADTDGVTALAIATTGADPKRHRIVRLSAARIGAEDRSMARLDLVVAPGRRVARYLVDGARLSTDEVEQAPTFPEIVSDLRAFLGEADIHAYGAAWVGAFLDAELDRAHTPALDNRLVEIDDPTRDLPTVGGKPTLASLAASLGIVHARPGVPPFDAESAARVVLALRERRNSSSADNAPAPATSVDPPSRPLLTRDWLSSVPSAAGVYWMADDTGAILYVGKAVDLRRRLGAYFGRAPGLHRRLEALSSRTARVEFRVAASDLEATLFEARLLAEHAPPFNVARRAHQPTTYIRIAPADDPPRVRLVREPAADGASYVGPLRSARVAQRAVATARAAFPDAFMRRGVDPQRQRAAVLAVARLLGGQRDEAQEVLRAAMAASACCGDQAGIDRARAALRAVQSLAVEPSALLGLGDGTRLLIVERVNDIVARSHLIEAGRHVGAADVDLSTWSPDSDTIEHLADRIASDGQEPSPLEPAHEQRIVGRWLAQTRSVLGVYRVPT